MNYWLATHAESLVETELGLLDRPGHVLSGFYKISVSDLLDLSVTVQLEELCSYTA